MDYIVKNLINDMLRAVEYEREEERERHLSEMKYLSGQEREKKGRAVINLKRKKIGRTISGEYLYQFSRKYNIETEISIGDQVIVSQDNPLDVQNPTGIVYEMTNKSITIAFTKQLRMGNNRPIRMDLSVNDTTYKRMEDALLHLKSPEFSKLNTILSGKYHVSTFEKDIKFKSLNDVQNQAVNLAYNNNGYYSIQGPPGTGKTYTAAHLIKTIVEGGKKVLITADSNAAVDHLIRHCAKLGLDPLRIGNPIRVNNDLKPYTLDYRVVKHALYSEIELLSSELEEVKVTHSHMDKPKPKDTRGHSYTELIELMDKNQASRGISKTTLKYMKPFLKIQKRMDYIYTKIQ
ncbi:AAA domain-containing protein, partial [Sphaerochaeta sp. S2]|uniref:AAA domain-containing protein n=1 Tax=Sphaerochaeta sp. S2 TaxID=2798868 RepID=UPI0018EA0BE1